MSDDPFVTHRSLLFTVAYEMLGSAADAEDVVQETWLRWAGIGDAAPDEVRDPRAYLVRIVTRQALNRLRSVSRRREEYVGEWLPEPLLTSPDVADDVELAESVSIAMLTVLETLGPDERAVFVLREVFDVPYDEIAEALGKSATAVRQIAHRARGHVAARRPRMAVSRSEQQQVVERFLAALTTGDLQGLMDVLAPDVVLVADGGGLAPAARHPIEGSGAGGGVPVPLHRSWRPARRSPPCWSTARSRPASGRRPVSSTPRSTSCSRPDGSPASMRSATRTSSDGWTRWRNCDGEAARERARRSRQRVSCRTAAPARASARPSSPSRIDVMPSSSRRCRNFSTSRSTDPMNRCGDSMTSSSVSSTPVRARSPSITRRASPCRSSVIVDRPRRRIDVELERLEPVAGGVAHPADLLAGRGERQRLRVELGAGHDARRQPDDVRFAAGQRQRAPCHRRR